VLNGTLPSGISDTGASSSCAPPTEQALIHTNQRSYKRFQVPTGEVVPATKQALLHHKLRGEARKVALVPGIMNNTLLSTGKMADENYIAIYDKEECNIYDGNTTKITVSKKEVLKGYRCPKTGQWRIPLKPVPHSHNHYFNNMPTPKTLISNNKQTILVDRPSPHDAIANVYELPSTEQTVRYLHAAAGFPTKPTWLAAIRKGSYDTWPGITHHTVNKYYPESDETPKGHMKQSPQGVRSTKIKQSPQGVTIPPRSIEATESPQGVRSTKIKQSPQGVTIPPRSIEATESPQGVRSTKIKQSPQARAASPDIVYEIVFAIA
jgi:hypothetical protein